MHERTSLTKEHSSLYREVNDEDEDSDDADNNCVSRDNILSRIE